MGRGGGGDGGDKTITTRIIGLQANTSDKSPEELDGLTYLDTSAPDELADLMMEAHARFGTRILGGCCGTDGSHMTALARRLGDGIE